MGRKDGIVSIWICTSLPSDEDGDFLKDDFKIGYYDLDEQETVGSFDRECTIDELLEELSYSSSFADPLKIKLEEVGILKAYLLISLFEFEYDGSIKKCEDDGVIEFIGNFEWNDDE